MCVCVCVCVCVCARVRVCARVIPLITNNVFFKQKLTYKIYGNDNLWVFMVQIKLHPLLAGYMKTNYPPTFS